MGAIHQLKEKWDDGTFEFVMPGPVPGIHVFLP